METTNLKINIEKLKKQFGSAHSDSLINDLIYSGVSQFLGISPGPISVVGTDGYLPNISMLQFLQDMDILIPEKEEDKTEVLHS